MGRLKRALPTLLTALGALVLLGGCVVYETAPGVYGTAPASTFDRSWAAAAGAFADESVRVSKHDRSTGTISGEQGGVVATAEVRQQADGSVQVEFTVTGEAGANPTLKDRLVGSYNRRMGR